MRNFNQRLERIVREPGVKISNRLSHLHAGGRLKTLSVYNDPYQPPGISENCSVLNQNVFDIRGLAHFRCRHSSVLNKDYKGSSQQYTGFGKINFLFHFSESPTTVFTFNDARPF